MFAAQDAKCRLIHSILSAGLLLLRHIEDKQCCEAACRKADRHLAGAVQGQRACSASPAPELEKCMSSILALQKDHALLAQRVQAQLAVAQQVRCKAAACRIVALRQL